MITLYFMNFLHTKQSRHCLFVVEILFWFSWRFCWHCLFAIRFLIIPSLQIASQTEALKSFQTKHWWLYRVGRWPPRQLSSSPSGTHPPECFGLCEYGSYLSLLPSFTAVFFIVLRCFYLITERKLSSCSSCLHNLDRNIKKTQSVSYIPFNPLIIQYVAYLSQ